MAITLQRLIRSPSCLVLGGVFGDGGSNGAISGCIRSNMAAGGYLEKLQMAKSLKRITDSLYVCTQTIHFALRL